MEISLNINMTGSPVPYLCLNKIHATSMPDTAEPAFRLPQDLSQSIVETLVLISVAIIDTSSMVHFRSSLLFVPDEITLTFSTDAHHKRS